VIAAGSLATFVVVLQTFIWIYTPGNLFRWVRAIGVLTIVFVIFCAMIAYAEECRLYGVVGPDNSNPVTDPLVCLYFSITTWTTVGYGDFRPTEAFRLIAASEAIVGYVFMALLIAALTFVVTAKDPDDSSKDLEDS
jgi:hypothetical protein